MGCTCSIFKQVEDKNKDQAPPSISNSMFIVQGLIGVGGFGEVLAVILQQTGKWYALKVINKAHLMKHKSGHSMICGELDALSRIGQHPFIVSLHVAYHDRRNCYFAMDLKTGGDLRYYLRKKMLFEERDVAFFVACISSALHHIHSKNMLHRDIKPENIILDERGWPHLADFGVAYVHNPVTAEEFGGTLTCTLASGTKQYLAPEVFCKAHIHGQESDFWSLAVVAYELLYAKRPFEKHCNIQYITYLERGLGVRRKQLKEMKMKDLANSRNSETTEVCAYRRPSSPEGLIFPITGAQSPDKYAHMRISPSFSASTSRETTSAYLPAISRSGSSDSLRNGYCSSVNYTPVHTSSRSMMGGTSGASSLASSRGNTPQGTQLDFSMEEQGRDRATSLQKSYDRLDNMLMNGGAISPVRPSTVAFGNSRGISFDNFESPTSSPSRGTHLLPKLGTNSNDSGNTTPPKQCRGPKPGIFLPPTSGSTTHVKALLQQQAVLHQQFSCNQKNPVAAHSHDQPGQVPFGDHWAVDDDAVLCSDLRVHIPSSNIWLGKISHECISFLKGMFDIRPSHRFSSRDVNAIRKHPWMQAHGLSDWQELYARNYTPNFKPGKRFMKETFADPSNTMLPGAGNALHDPDGDTSADTYFEARRQQQLIEDGVEVSGDSGKLTPEQHASFRGFRYTSEALQGLFINKEPELASPMSSASVSN